MIDIREYRAVIAQTVKEVNAADKAYSWKVAGVSAGEAKISWSYLSKAELFVLKVEESCGDEYVSVTVPCIGHKVVILVGPSKWDDAQTIEEGIAKAIRAAASRAHYVF